MKTRFITRKISLILLLCLFLPMSFACSDPGKPDPTAGTTAGGTASEDGPTPPDEDGFIVDDTYRICVTDGLNIWGSQAFNYIKSKVRAATDVNLKSVFPENAPETVIALSVSEDVPDGKYTLLLDKKQLTITASDGETLYLATRAITDKWVSAKGGLSGKTLKMDAGICKSLRNLTIDKDTFVIMSQNLRYNDDPEGTVKERSERFFQLLDLAQPDIIGTQECTYEWKGYLEEELGEIYGMVGVSRNGPGVVTGEWGMILYRLDRFELRGNGDFWLSDTPSEPSKFPTSSQNRICTWARLYDKAADREILMCNTHLDHKMEKADQAEQAQVILDFLADDFGKLPIFLTGDFNATDKEAAIVLVKTAFTDSFNSDTISKTSAIQYTHNGYGKNTSRIDYCFYTPPFVTAMEYHIWDNKFDDKYVSDHYGLTTKFIYN